MSHNSKSFNKFIATATTVTIVAGAVAPLAFAASFNDVASKYKEAVDFLVSKGINGTSETTFGTYENIKRVDAAIFVVNALGLNIESAPNSGFTDVPSRAVKHVNALKAAGITSGKTTTTFASQDLITRGELAMWLQKGFELKASEEKLAFNDVAPKYQEAVSALVGNKITKGTSTTTFGTHDNAKRGDFAIFVYKAAQIKNEVATPAVKSVSALNAKQIAVQFNTALAEGTTIAQLEAAFSLEGKKIVAKTAELSDDRKTVIYTLDNTEVENATLTILPLETATKDENNKAVQTGKYVSLFSFDDVVAPSVSETTFANYTDGKADATISFNEQMSTVGTVSVNGVEEEPVIGTDSFTLEGLEVGKTYTIDIVGAKDTAISTPNKAEHLTLSFTVPAKQVDSTIPTVSTSTNGNKLTLTFSEEVTPGTVTIGGVAVAANDVIATDAKTYVIDVQKANAGAFFTSNKNFFTSEVVVKGFADKASTPNAMKEVKFNSTFTADKTAATLAGATALENGKIVLEFNEEVTESTIDALTVKSIDGVFQTSKTLTVESALHPVVDGKEVNNKLELTLAAETQLVTGKNYVVEIASNKVEDNYSNKNANAISFSVVRPAATGTQADAVVTTTISEDKNIIDIVFANTDKDGMSDSVLAAANYKVGDKVLPSTTDIKFVDNKNKVRITLPESFVTVNGNYTFVASNLTDLFGNTLALNENIAELALTENVAPTVASALTVNGSNEVLVSFSEAVISNDLDNDAKLLEGITVKVNGTTATSTNSVVSGQLKVVLTDAITASDKVTVDFNKAELTDASGNQVKNGTARN